MKVRIHSILLVVLVASAAVCGGCGGSTQPANAPAAATAPATNPVDPATAGTITGSVKLEGTPPAADTINLSSDDYCVKNATNKTTRVYVVDGGGLQNVFVYVKDGLGNLKFPVPTEPVVLDQNGCWYVPRVFGIQVGQPFNIVNSDDTLHNIHALPMSNREFNRGQKLKGEKYQTVFTVPEVMVPFKCDVHRWMNAWVGVVSHPFYAVSGAGGNFELKGLPPGTYTIEAWHEKLGTQTQTVTLGAKESKPVTFNFKI